jgi:hypothetical protein
MSGVVLMKLQDKVVVVMLLNLSQNGLLNQRRDMTTMRPEAEIQPSVSQTQRPQPLSRLQKRAPAKMQLKKLSPDSMELSFRSPIPLLSPVVLSLSGTGDLDRLLFTEEDGKQNPEESVDTTTRRMDGSTTTRRKSRHNAII